VAQIRQNLVDYAIHTVRGLGGAYVRLASNSLSDILLFHSGSTVAVRRRGKPRPEQVSYAQTIDKKGELAGMRFGKSCDY
jgi:hypothetical protein